MFGKQNTLPLSIVVLESCDRWSHKYLSYFYMAAYKGDKLKQRRYQRITAWYDALNKLDRSNFKEDYMFPMEILMQLESDIIIQDDCELCVYNGLMTKFEFHNLCCEDDHPCYMCREVNDCLECLDVGARNCMYHFDFFSKTKSSVWYMHVCGCACDIRLYV